MANLGFDILFDLVLLTADGTDDIPLFFISLIVSATINGQNHPAPCKSEPSVSNDKSIANTTIAKMTEATITTIVELWSCGNVGHVTLFTSSL